MCVIQKDNMAYIFSDGKHFVVISNYTDLHKTKNIDKASYWTSKKKILSWESLIKSKYPNMEIKEVGFIIKDQVGWLPKKATK